MIYTLIETAKANKLDVYRYLRFLFENLPLAETEDDYKKLLPSKVTGEQVSAVSQMSVV
jgi:transposase